MKNKLTQIIVAILLMTSIVGNAQKKEKSQKKGDNWKKFAKKLYTKSPEVQATMRKEWAHKWCNNIIDTTFDNSEFIFEAENASDSNQNCISTQYQIDSLTFIDGSKIFERELRYHKIYITKIYKGQKHLKLGTAFVLNEVSNRHGGSYGKKYNFGISRFRNIFFSKKSNFPTPTIVNDKVDNQIFLTNHHTYLYETTDSTNTTFYQLFSDMNSSLSLKKYYNIEQELLKGRKGVKINGDRVEQVIPKRKPIVVEPLIIDTTGYFQKEKKRKADSVLRWQDIHQIDLDYKQYKIDSAANPEKKLKFAPAWYFKKMGVKPKI